MTGWMRESGTSEGNSCLEIHGKLRRKMREKLKRKRKETDGRGRSFAGRNGWSSVVVVVVV